MRASVTGGLRGAALASAVAGVVACSSSSNAPAVQGAAPAADAGPVGDATAQATTDGAGLQAQAFTHQTIRDVDVLFVVDVAPGMAPLLARLGASFAAFTDTLRDIPAGYPSLHVAVVSADLGAGSWDDPGCTPGGDRGVFWSVPRGACAPLGLPAGQSFFSIVDGKTNFDPGEGLADALACVAPRDDAGCLFPHPLAAALRALGADGQPAPPENAGFLRPGAFLSIVVVTNQDDCSAPPDTQIFDSSSMLVGDRFGPLTSFRCAEFGLSCGGAAPSRTTGGALSDCHSAEDGILLRLSDAVSHLGALKADPNMILVAALSGPPDPFVVELDPPELAADGSPWPALAPSCTSADGAVSARPGVRVEQWVYAFGHNGVLTKACDDVADSLRAIATSIAGVLGPPCLTGAFAKVAGPRGPRPDCTIVDYSATADGGAAAPVPACVDTGGAPPCWTLTDDAACPGGKLLGFEAPPGAPAFGANSSVTCTVCDDPADPRCR
jgi:hypothetical protein